jgi:hypothetical protein
MIRWCSFCQRFLGEIQPFDDPRFTHGICVPCDQKLARGEDVKEQTAPVRLLFSRIMDGGRAGDEHACASILEEARAMGAKHGVHPGWDAGARPLPGGARMARGSTVCGLRAPPHELV